MPAQVSHSVPRPPEVLKASYSVPSSVKCSRPSSGSAEMNSPSWMASQGWQYSLIRPSTDQVRLYLSCVGREGRQRADAHLHVAHLDRSRLARWWATMPMKPGARPHCGMKAVLAPSARSLDGLGGGHVLGQVEVVAAAFQRQSRAAVMARWYGSALTTVSLPRSWPRPMPRCFRCRPARPGMPSAASLASAGADLVDHGDLVVAGGMQQAGDGLADMAGAEQGNFHGRVLS